MSTTNPYAVTLKDGRTVTDLSYANAEEAVRLYGAEWLSRDSALTAISAERAEHRLQRTVDAKEASK